MEKVVEGAERSLELGFSGMRPPGRLTSVVAASNGPESASARCHFSLFSSLGNMLYDSLVTGEFANTWGSLETLSSLI
jgi:hypothetical protein